MVCTPEPAGTWQTLPESSTSPRGPLMLSLSLTMDTALSDTTDSDMEATDTATPV